MLLPGRQMLPRSADMEQIVSETAQLIKNGMEKKEALKLKAHEYEIKKSTLYKFFIDNPI